MQIDGSIVVVESFTMQLLVDSDRQARLFAAFAYGTFGGRLRVTAFPSGKLHQPGEMRTCLSLTHNNSMVVKHNGDADGDSLSAHSGRVSDELRFWNCVA